MNPSTSAGGSGAATLRQPRVLVVEDEYFVALSIEGALVDAGMTVVGVATTADQAVEMAHSEGPDVVLMDIRLRGARDGIDAAAEILDRTGIPSIFATAQADPGTRRRGERLARPLGWVSKPFSPGEVVAAIKQGLARWRAGRGG